MFRNEIMMTVFVSDACNVMHLLCLSTCISVIIDSAE